MLTNQERRELIGTTFTALIDAVHAWEADPAPGFYITNDVLEAASAYVYACRLQPQDFDDM